MGFAVATISFDTRVRHSGFPGQWDVVVTNTSRLTTSYTPLVVMAESETIELDGVEFLTEDSAQLQPGESMQFLLKLKRAGFEQLEGWGPEDFNPEEKMVLLIRYLGIGASPELAVVELPKFEGSK